MKKFVTILCAVALVAAVSCKREEAATTDTVVTDTVATDTMATDTMATDTMSTDTMATDTMASLSPLGRRGEGDGARSNRAP